MLTIENPQRFHRFLEIQKENKTRLLLLSMLLFGSMGAITWAIRGTAGWGGVDGTVVPGMMWGLLWYYLSCRMGLDARGIVFWLGFGIALGGELGYGQYVSWMQGVFYVADKTISVDPLNGYLWMAICGIGWAAPGGILLGWALNNNISSRQWIMRFFMLMLLLIFLFAWPVIDWVAAKIVSFWPALIFPNANLGIYDSELGRHLQRTVYTNTQNFLVLLWWLFSLLLSAFQKDKNTLTSGLVLGVGFGIGFMQSAVWTLGYVFAPQYIDWWKMWEINAGFNLGILYALIFFWSVKRTAKIVKEKIRTEKEEKRISYISAITGALFIFFMGFEYFFWPAILLSVLFILVMFISTIPQNKQDGFNFIREKRLDILLVFSIFILIFLMLHGVSETAGIFLGLYQHKEVAQYSWPIERIILVLPFMLILFTIVLKKIRQIIVQSKNNEINTLQLNNRMVELMAAMGSVGALSIWPSKIGVLYSFFLLLALFAFSRINIFFEKQKI